MIARVFVVLFAGCIATAAEAQVTWSTPGTACVPSDATIKFDRHKVGVASVQHANTNVDPIVLSCPVAPFDGGTGIWNLIITYQDSTGKNDAAFARAQLYRMQIGSATPVLMATANSNSAPATTVNTVASPNFTHPFSFNNNIYWVRVQLHRSSTSQSVILHSVILASPL
jgi:hypothetical protein